MNNKTIIEIGFRIIRRIMEISEGVICRGRNCNIFLNSIIANYSSTKMLIKKYIMKKSAVFKLELLFTQHLFFNEQFIF